jgi:hypothetical protein
MLRALPGGGRRGRGSGPGVAERHDGLGNPSAHRNLTSPDFLTYFRTLLSVLGNHTPRSSRGGPRGRGVVLEGGGVSGERPQQAPSEEGARSCRRAPVF